MRPRTEKGRGWGRDEETLERLIGRHDAEGGFLPRTEAPKKSPGDKIEIPRVGEGGGGIPQGGAEDAGPGGTVVMGPARDMGKTGRIEGASQGDDAGFGGFDAIEFFAGNLPGSESFQDGICRGERLDPDGALAFVGASGETGEVEPALVSDTEGHHRPVEEHGREPRPVRCEDTIDVGGVRDAGEAVVVDDDVVILGPIGGFKEGDAGIALPCPLEADDPLDGTHDSLADAAGEDLLPDRVFVGTTSGDQQGADRRRWWWILLPCEDRSKNDRQRQKDRAENDAGIGRRHGRFA